jgi:hypothetical protein
MEGEQDGFLRPPGTQLKGSPNEIGCSVHILISVKNSPRMQEFAFLRI